MRALLMLLSLVTLPTFAEERSGAAVYESTCSECHGTGKLNAPLFANKHAWGKLVREGLDDLAELRRVGNHRLREMALAALARCLGLDGRQPSTR